MRNVNGFAALFFISMTLLVFSDVYAQQVGNVRSITLPDIEVKLSEGQGLDAVERNCIMCHSLDYIPMQPRFTKAQWAATVNKMIKTFGAPVAAEDVETITGYLSARYGTGN